MDSWLRPRRRRAARTTAVRSEALPPPARWALRLRCSPRWVLGKGVRDGGRVGGRVLGAREDAFGPAERIGRIGHRSPFVDLGGRSSGLPSPTSPPAEMVPNAPRLGRTVQAARSLSGYATWEPEPIPRPFSRATDPTRALGCRQMDDMTPPDHTEQEWMLQARCRSLAAVGVLPVRRCRGRQGAQDL